MMMFFCDGKHILDHDEGQEGTGRMPMIDVQWEAAAEVHFPLLSKAFNLVQLLSSRLEEHARWKGESLEAIPSPHPNHSINWHWIAPEMHSFFTFVKLNH